MSGVEQRQRMNRLNELENATAEAIESAAQSIVELRSQVLNLNTGLDQTNQAVANVKAELTRSITDQVAQTLSACDADLEALRTEMDARLQDFTTVLRRSFWGRMRWLFLGR